MEIDKIVFEVFDRHEILGMSSVHVTNTMNNVQFKQNRSMHDTRFGSFKNIQCPTCKRFHECPGHFGHISLVMPVLNPLFVNTNLRDILDSFCFGCFDLLTVCVCGAGGARATKRRKILKAIRIKMSQHESYSYLNHGIKLSFSIDGNPLTLNELYQKIKSISRAKYLKWRPSYHKFTDLSDSCFIHNLPVLPVSSRPPNFSGGEWRSDHITRLYIEVLKHNKNLQMRLNVVIEALIVEFHNEIQNAVNVLFDVNNTSKKLQHHVLQNGGLRQRIDGKNGRIRMNLMGKRTEFSARSVLSGDPNLGMNEIGIPNTVALNLTIPILINRYNHAEMINYKKYNIRYVLKANGDRFDLSRSSSFSPNIEIGDIVERSLINGDIVAVNRQPTLHRGSILAVRVKIMKTSTFRLNYSSLVTLNGDCDGDEVNIHVPQDLKSKAELENLMLSSTNIVASQDSKPLVGLIQDALLGCFQLSKKQSISKIDFMDLLYQMGIYDVLLTQNTYRGVQIIDFALEHLHVDLLDFKIEKANFYLKDNKVVSGVFNKAVLGASDNSIIHHIFLSYGHLKAERFIFLMQKAATTFLDVEGFSVGIEDCMVQHEQIHHKKLDEFLKQRHEKHNELPDEHKLMNATGMITKLEEPNSVTTENNALLAMIKSGSKGSMMNFNQITRIVGQQIVGAGRVLPEIADASRTLPHFKANDFGLYSRGFVKNSYLKGLTPTEFFFHAQAGRIGCIDTSCKTASTGYTFRKLVKSLERCIVDYGPDGEMIVKNMATNQIVQFKYGEDSFDGTFLKRLIEE